jgi:fumarylacetoacetate (FAA) hydrolase
VLLATRKDPRPERRRDGRLHVVRRDRAAWTDASDIAPTLQAALDDWDTVAPRLAERQAALEQGRIRSEPFDAAACRAPLPRAYEWVDGSAYINHIVLVRKARGAEPPPTLRTDPLVYQGGSGTFLDPTSPIPCVDPAWGVDFESEVCAVLGDVPLGTRKEDALRYVRLLLIANDVTLRNLVPDELAKGFGFFQSKPSTAFAPIALTPDELGPAWRDGRVHLRLVTRLNGEIAGDVDAGPEMHFSFADLIAHLAKTRPYTAGTILGSGTVSNEDETRGVSCLAERRMREILATGAPKTRFLQPGDHVRIEMFGPDGASLFGAIDQVVAQEGGTS